MSSIIILVLFEVSFDVKYLLFLFILKMKSKNNFQIENIKIKIPLIFDKNWIILCYKKHILIIFCFIRSSCFSESPVSLLFSSTPGGRRWPSRVINNTHFRKNVFHMVSIEMQTVWGLAKKTKSGFWKKNLATKNFWWFRFFIFFEKIFFSSPFLFLFIFSFFIKFKIF